MTAEERNTIKALLDAYARRLFESDGRYLDRCRECGGEQLGWTLGCHACGYRHHAKAKRGTHPDMDWYLTRSAQAAAHRNNARAEGQRAVVQRNRSGIRGKRPTVPGQRSYA